MRHEGTKTRRHGGALGGKPPVAPGVGVARRRERRGAVMVEFVLVLPLLMLVLALLFYFGSLAVRVQQGNAMARYEVWRSAMDGEGPGAASDGGADELRSAFYPGEASAVERTWSAADFPELPYQRLMDGAGAASADAGRLAWAWVRDMDGRDRQPRGLGEVFEVSHAGAAERWGRISRAVQRDAEAAANPERAPLRRGQVRVRGAWGYIEQWRASSPTWLADLEGSTAAVDATRDAFLDPLDLLLESEARAQGSRSGVNERDTLTGLLRVFYLETPAYRGPEVME